MIPQFPFVIISAIADSERPAPVDESTLADDVALFALAFSATAFVLSMIILAVVLIAGS
jgi:hypothetical protein